jgi:hypothetical protein
MDYKELIIIKSITGINYVFNNKKYKIGTDIDFINNNDKIEDTKYVGFHFENDKQNKEYLKNKYTKFIENEEDKDEDDVKIFLNIIKNKNKLLYADNIDDFSERDILLKISSNMFWIYLLYIIDDIVNENIENVYNSIKILKSDKDIEGIHIYNTLDKPLYDDIKVYIKKSLIENDKHEYKIFRLKIYSSYLIYLNPLLTKEDLQYILSIIYKPLDIDDLKINSFSINHGKYVMNLDPYITEVQQLSPVLEENDERLVVVE